MGDKIDSEDTCDDWGCFGNRSDSEPICNEETSGSNFDSVELDGETVKVDLREQELDGCSSGDVALVRGDKGGENEWGKLREDLEVLGVEWGNEGEDESCGDPWSEFDLWTPGEQVGSLSVFEVGVLIDVFEVLGVSVMRHADC